MRTRVWLRDLRSGAGVVFGVVAGVLTLIAIASAVAGTHVATPWLIVAALAFALASVFLAYVRAAKERDEKIAPSVDMSDYVRRDQLTDYVRVKDNGDGTATITVDNGGEPQSTSGDQ